MLLWLPMRATSTAVKKNPKIIKQLRKQTVKDYINNTHKTAAKHIYIASFCGLPSSDNHREHIEQNGLLSQWRGYGDRGGVAIQLNTKRLKKLLDLEEEKGLFEYAPEQLQLLASSYNKNEANENLKEELKLCKKYFIEFSKYWDKNEDEKAFEVLQNKECYNSFMKVMTSCKHPSFHEENEVRIIARPIRKGEVPTVDNEKEIHFRSNGHIQIPYIKLFENLEENLPIEKIIIGPQKDQKKQARSLELFLEKHKKHDLSNIKITCSETPYTGA